MSGALERDELPARRLGERYASRVGVERILVAVDDEHRTANAPAELPEVAADRQVDAGVVVREHVGGRVSSAQPTASSIGFVECGSVKHFR